jgi:hypothetical protein
MHEQGGRFSAPGSARGALIVAGGRDMFANAAITLHVLRRVLRSALPVEIVHFGGKELPPPKVLQLIAALNGSAVAAADGSSSSGSSGSGSSSSSAVVGGPVFITDALAVAPPPEAAAGHLRGMAGGIKGFPAKVYALAHVTRFRQVRCVRTLARQLGSEGGQGWWCDRHAWTGLLWDEKALSARGWGGGGVGWGGAGGWLLLQAAAAGRR